MSSNIFGMGATSNFENSILKILSDVLVRLYSNSDTCVKLGFSTENNSVIDTPIKFYLKRPVFESKTFNICCQC